jgi:hypothetical protein
MGRMSWPILSVVGGRVAGAVETLAMIFNLIHLDEMMLSNI